MREGWKEILLSDHCYFINGGSWSDKEYVEAGIPVIKVTNMVDGGISFEQLDHIPESSRKKYEKHLLKKGDLVVATVGSHPTQPNSVVGRTSMIPSKGDGHLLNQNAVCVRVFHDDNSLHPLFLFYFTQTTHFKHYAATRAKGSANQVRLAISELKKYKFPAPPLPLQTRIAHLLSAYDELIEVNNRRIALLEQTAEQLYKEWFVRLRFPGYEGTAVRKGAPEGWREIRFPEAVEINPRMKFDKHKEYTYVDMGGLSESSMIITSQMKRKPKGGAKFINGDILFSRITPCLQNGKMGFVHILEDGELGFGSTEFIVFRSKSLTPEFVYFLSRDESFRQNAINSMVGASGRQRVDNRCFDSFIFLHPPQSILEQFSSVVMPMFKQIFKLNDQNQTLRRTRDLLLPRLISGQLSVQAAEAALNG